MRPRLLLAILAVALPSAYAQEAWKPARPVTLIAPNAPGGTSDRAAREIQRIIQKHRLAEVPVHRGQYRLRGVGGGGLVLYYLRDKVMK